ncbi:MAG: phosphoglycolate phosphatase [Anaerolineae bacterium]|nr:MAG: phosphoglycolate phosphatase [Anaerolineae bacterium]
MLRHPLDFKAYFFDLDGTVYLGKKPLPNVRETLKTLRAMGKQLLFLTNDASLSRENIAAKLLKMNIAVTPEEIINPSSIAIRYLSQHSHLSPLFVIGEGDLTSDLIHAGVALSQDPAQIRSVLVSTDHHFNYRKLKIAFDAIRNGAIFLATNADRTYPTQKGDENPDAGAIIAALEACTGRRLDILLGKPATFMAELALETVNLPPEECLLIGDNPETDIRMGNQAGIATALVRGGLTMNHKSFGAEETPTYLLNNVADLLGYI